MDQGTIDEVIITGSEKKLEGNLVLNLHIICPEDGRRVKTIKPNGIDPEMVVKAINYLGYYLAQEGKDDLLKPSDRPY